jgi:hypothetical protein
MKEYLKTKEECREHHCKINKKNIAIIYKPDIGLKKSISTINSKKFCDCIIECNNNCIVIVEILCGKLTYSEFKDKIEQLQNCIEIVKFCKKIDKLKKVILLYDTIDTKSNPSLKKKLINCTVKGYIVEVIQNKKFDGIIC